MNADIAIARYIDIAPRLPTASMPAATRYVAHLGELVNDIDAFVLDGFGVLNVGATSVPGAAERVTELQLAGKRVVVLTNGATAPSYVTRRKYQHWGMEFDSDDVISSRNGLKRALSRPPWAHQPGRWGVSAMPHSELDELGVDAFALDNNPASFDAADGFVLLGAGQWSEQQQGLLTDALRARQRPVLVGNPDLVAPHEGEFSIEPGFYAHDLMDSFGSELDIAFYGKPFPDVFELATARLPGVDPSRIAMVGDSLHTDILGGAAAGWKTCLITDHGLVKASDLDPLFERSGIRPDFVARTT